MNNVATGKFPLRLYPLHTAWVCLLLRLTLGGLVLVLASCNSSDFSAGTVTHGQKEKTPAVVAPTTETKPSSTEVLLFTDLSFSLIAEGVQGTCNQSILKGGQQTLTQKIIPAINSNLTTTVVSGTASQYQDILLAAAGKICPTAESSWRFGRNVVYCRRTAGGPGATSIENPFGTANVCGNQISNQPQFSDPSRPFSKIIENADGSSRHFIIASIKKGSSMSADMFIATVKKNLGAATRVSVIYPKNADACEKASIIPPAGDASWVGLPSTSQGPSTVFEEIASQTGGHTYDLCNPSDLETIGKK